MRRDLPIIFPHNLSTVFEPWLLLSLSKWRDPFYLALGATESFLTKQLSNSIFNCHVNTTVRLVERFMRHMPDYRNTGKPIVDTSQLTVTDVMSTFRTAN